MLAAEKGIVPAVCPECVTATLVRRSDLGRDLVCDGCGTRYCVLREIRRKRRPAPSQTSASSRTPAPRELEEAACGPSLPPPESLSRVVKWVLLGMALVVAAVPIMAHHDAIWAFMQGIWVQVHAVFRWS